MAVAAITIYSCKKDGTTQLHNSDNFNVSVAKISSNGEKSLGNNSCLAFATIADYKIVMSQPTPQVQTAFSNLLKSFSTFTSYTQTYPNDTLFDDPYLTNLLNADGVIQIGTNYFKVDPILQKVFVLPVAQSAYYYDLISASPQSGKVIMFSTNDNVLDLLQAGALQNLVLQKIDITTTIPALGEEKSFISFIRHLQVLVATVVDEVAHDVGLTCADNPAQANVVSGTKSYGDGYRLACVIKYINLGLDFKLFAKVNSQVQLILKLKVYVPFTAQLRITPDAEWKRRCGTQQDETEPRDSTKISLTYPFYSDIRALTTYDVSAVFQNINSTDAAMSLNIHYP